MASIHTVQYNPIYALGRLVDNQAILSGDIWRQGQELNLRKFTNAEDALFFFNILIFFFRNLSTMQYFACFSSLRASWLQ